MVSCGGFKFLRGVRSVCLPITTVVGFTLLLTWLFVLYQPNYGPGRKQRISWQSWESVSADTISRPAITKPSANHSRPEPVGPGDSPDVDWWNVTQPEDKLDYSSLPLDVWSPLLPHSTGLSEISVTRCYVDPDLADDICAPGTTKEMEAIKGKWVRVQPNLNREGGYMAGYLNVYYRRTRRQDINLITDIKLLSEQETPSPTPAQDHWHRAPTSLRAGILRTPPLYLWYKTGKTAADMTAEEKNNIITEIDVLWGEDVPWYGFEKLEPPTMEHMGRVQSTRLTFRRGVKSPPKAPPLHFSRDGKFKILQVADLHYSVSPGACRDTPLKPCEGADNLTNTLVGHMLDLEKPDLVVFSGDQLNGQGTSWDPKSVLAKFAKAVTDRKIPWAAVFGNHDEDDGLRKEFQVNLLKSLPYSLVERGPKDIHGVGNYVLKSYSADASKTQLLTLYFLDSGSYSKGFLDWLGFFNPTEYDYIRQNQIDWFLQESASIKPIERPFKPDTGKDLGDAWKRQDVSDQITPTTRKLARPNALMFFHMPLPETYNKADLDMQSSRPLDKGISGQEAPGNANTNDGFFEKGIMQALESDHMSHRAIPEVKVIGNGHCHLTENCRRVKGVWFCFGGGGSYAGYGKIGFDRRFRVYEISDYGETIRTYKRTEKDEVVDSMLLAGSFSVDREPASALSAAESGRWLPSELIAVQKRDHIWRFSSIPPLIVSQLSLDTMAARGQPQANGHSARHPSISSIQAQDTGNSQRGGSGNPAVESAVTRLLVSIKALLESLTQWSQQRVDESQVSDVYVRLGNDFNAAVAAFAAFNIDMAELVSVPEDLRAILEQCLAEEATPENLEIYLPEVRQIITNLLQGLRAKQSIYRRIASEHRRSGDQRHERMSSRSERASRSHRTQSSRTIPEEERQEAVTGSMSRRSAGRSRREVTSQTAAVIQPDEPFVGGFAPTIVEHVTGPEHQTVSPRRSQPQLLPQTAPGRSSPAPPTLPELSLTDPTSLTTTTLNNEPPPPAPPVQQAPANAKRYSLVDKPVTSPPLPTVSIEPSSPDPTINGIASPSTESIALEPSPAVANSLAALKKNDVLERRASKRFSTYNISKMTGASTTRERSLRNHPHRRSLASNAAPTPTELAVLTEEGDEEEDDDDVPLRRRIQSRAASPEPKAETSTAGRRPITPARAPDLPVPPAMNAFPTQDAAPSRITVFLQLGREVKKVGIEPPLSFATLRVLFVDKFSYNPGQDNFPAIYIRDPSSGVQYELEDVEEVKDKCLLSLNIEALDQIKQHIDSQMSALSQDIKDLKTAVAQSNKQPAFQPPPPMFADMTLQPLAESTPARPSDRQLQSVARRISKFVGKDSSFATAILQQQDSPPPTYVVPQITGQSLMPQMTGASVMSEYSNRVVQDLKIQFDEVQNLRRDLAVLRQTYLDFMKKTKEALGTLRTQTQSVRQLATTSVGGARAYIDSGKKKLDARSQDILTEVEKLQDTVERVKDDVIKRNTTPKPQYFKSIKKDIDAAAAELESLKEHIKTVKPMWKKTWEEELQNIVEEQQFLTHQEEFLGDLLDDHKAVLEIYGHVEKIVNLRGPSANGPGRRGRGPTFRPPPPEEGHNGLSTVMLEIRGAAIDPAKRLKAIEESQRNREMERNARGDEMQVELSEFVGQKKLRMTGGAEEVERLRQKRDEMSLKAMFSPANSALSLHSQDTGNFEYPSSPS